MRALVPAPRLDAAAAKEFGDWRDAETEAFRKSEREGAAYVPTRKDRRVMRDTTSGAAGAAIAVVREPAGPAETFDERVVAAALGYVGEDGRARVGVAVDAARRDDLTRWTSALVGREVAIVRDGVVTERIRVTVPWAATFEVLAAGEGATPPDEMARARADASAIALGRLPRPLAPVPAGEARTTGELLAPSLERAILAIGSAAIPALERLASADVEAPRKSLVARALTTLRTRAEREEEAAREEKIRAAKAKEKPPEGEADPRDAAANGDGEPAPPK